MRKIKYGSKAWHESVLFVAESLNGTIGQCRKCGHATTEGWCCFACGCDNSISEKKEKELQDEYKKEYGCMLLNRTFHSHNSKSTRKDDK